MTIFQAITAASVTVTTINLTGMTITTIGGERLIPRDSFIDRNFGRSILVLDALVWLSAFALFYI